MRRINKRILSIVMTVCILFVPTNSASAATSMENEIMPIYNNVNSVTANATISNSGKLTINYKYTGISGITTKAVITTYLEKKTLGLFWKRVDIGTTDNQWVTTVKNYKYSGSRQYQLSSSGTYRITVSFKIYGTGGSADTVKKAITEKY